MDKAKARREAYSDDEYDDLSQFQRRRRKGARSANEPGDERDYGMGSEDAQGQKDFWDEATNEGQGAGRRNHSKADFEKHVFDEFDEFFNFSD